MYVVTQAEKEEMALELERTKQALSRLISNTLQKTHLTHTNYAYQRDALERNIERMTKNLEEATVVDDPE